MAGRRLTPWAWSIGSLLLITSVHGAALGVGGGGASTITFSCDLVGAIVAVPEERAREVLPTGYEPTSVAGMARASVIAATCTGVRIDGGPPGTMLYALISVESAEPAGTYDVWERTDNAEWHAAMARLGKASDLSGEMELVASLDAPARMLRMSAPGESGGFELAALIVEAPTPTIPSPSIHLYEGPRGRVVGSHANDFLAAGPAMVLVETEAGSAAARLLGGEHVTAPGLWLRFDAAAEFTLAS